jgi:LPXTG-site transpeptidase (sortase) family protein
VEAAQRPLFAHASRGTAIAMLSIPRVHLSAAVLHGSDDQTLRRGPGHLENTAFPGESGNAVIAGHRDSYFRPLRNITIGDDIFLDTPEGQFHYRVTSTGVVTSRDVSVLAETSETVLTLITCFPFSLLGNAPDRFIVRAAAVVTGVAAPPALDLSARHESQPAPITKGSVDDESVVATAEVVPDDDSLVRAAVERFRATYNTRLGNRSDGRPLAPLRLQTCTIVVTGDQATASCAAVEPSVDEPHDRAFMLERADTGWAIRAVVAK